MDGDGSRLAGRCYQAKALVTESLNEGAITAKKNNVGGIVGRMDLGSIVACEGYGSVSSTSGDYVGGVAGFSAAVIRQSWAKCTLEGNAYVGGVAGFGSRISDCHTCVELKKGTAYLGAVAGDMDTDGELAGNSFVQESVGGVDEISYCGKAEPVSFETLRAMGNIPERFMQFELTFLAKGELVARIPFQYGEALEALPDIPLQKGYSAQWPAIDYQYLTFSQTLEAQYLPYRSALSTEAETPQILVDGSFSSEAEILQTAFPAQWTDAAGKVYSGMAYTVALEDPLLPNSSLTIHYKLSGNSKRYTLWVQKEAGWESQEFETDGSYLLWRAVDNPTTFCVIEQKRHWLLVIFLTAAGGVLLFWLWKKISAIR